MWEQSGYPTTEPPVTGQAHRHQNLSCEGISGGWKDNHQVCEVGG